MTNTKIQNPTESENSKSRNFDLDKRSLKFASLVAKLMIKLPESQVNREYGRQVIRSSASIGANIEEADGTLSKRDFVNKLSIARREARESRYWLKLIKEVDLITNTEYKLTLESLVQESNELMLILSAIINKIRRNNDC